MTLVHSTYRRESVEIVAAVADDARRFGWCLRNRERERERSGVVVSICIGVMGWSITKKAAKLH